MVSCFGTPKQCLSEQNFTCTIVSFFAGHLGCPVGGATHSWNPFLNANGWLRSANAPLMMPNERRI
jgi:hypothetical protein